VWERVDWFICQFVNSLIGGYIFRRCCNGRVAGCGFPRVGGSPFRGSGGVGRRLICQFVDSSIGGLVCSAFFAEQSGRAERPFACKNWVQFFLVVAMVGLQVQNLACIFSFISAQISARS